MTAASDSRDHPGSGMPLVRQLRRAFGREENPLCRSVDRARSRLLVSLVAGLAAALAVGVLVAMLLLTGMRAHARQIDRHRHEVTATTLSAATDTPQRSLWSAQASADWVYPAAHPRSGTIGVPSGTVQGSRVPLWVDDSGTPAAPAQPDSELATAASLYGIGALSAAGTACWIGYCLRRRALDKRAERSWEPDWERVEPLWSGRGHGKQTGGV
ncbi:Rv1733c family protein [Kitasatospora sp. LaBMicrA B282]|uniref:Rv1733c family protein n=1 Tax=Kitasatospora sp. LaBMicrA B282 TaxID=3420949 RepID=UPI003D0B2C30